MGVFALLKKHSLIITGLLIIFIIILALYVKKRSAVSIFEPHYIVCFPRGGFIYMIHRIIAAYKFAVDNNRVLIIDTRRNWFKESLYDYFFIHSPYVYVGDIDFLYGSLDKLSMYPLQVPLKTMNVDLATENSGALRKYNIDLTHDYDEQVVIYSHYGGGSSVKLFFSMCSLTPVLYKAYKTARDKLPASYVAIHIRNTDYKSNVDEFLKKHTDLIKDKPIFLASDSKGTIELFKKQFNVFSFSDIPENYGHNLHEMYSRSGDDIRKYNLDTIVDLLLLAAGSELYYSYAESTFTQAAIELHEDPELLARLLVEPKCI
jgi:hypothetical protein